MTITMPTQHTQAHSSPSPLARAQSGEAPEQIILPMPPSLSNLAMGQDTRFEMDVYARFMRHLRNVPNSRMEIKILSSIRFTADMLDVGEELVAKILVDLGLRAPRKAFPGGFLDFCDKCLLRRTWETAETGVSDAGAMPKAVIQLKEHWDSIGEDRFHVSQYQYAVYNAGALV